MGIDRMSEWFHMEAQSLHEQHHHSSTHLFTDSLFLNNRIYHKHTHTHRVSKHCNNVSGVNLMVVHKSSTRNSVFNYLVICCIPGSWTRNIISLL